MTEFIVQNCMKAERMDGKAFYLGRQGDTCAIVDKCEGPIETDDTVTTANVYQVKEEKSMLSWMHFFQ